MGEAVWSLCGCRAGGGNRSNNKKRRPPERQEEDRVAASVRTAPAAFNQTGRVKVLGLFSQSIDPPFNQGRAVDVTRQTEFPTSSATSNAPRSINCDADRSPESFVIFIEKAGQDVDRLSTRSTIGKWHENHFVSALGYAVP